MDDDCTFLEDDDLMLRMCFRLLFLCCIPFDYSVMADDFSSVAVVAVIVFRLVYAPVDKMPILPMHFQ